MRTNLDFPIFGALILITIIGLMTLYSASGNDTTLLINQGIRVGIAIGLMLVVAQIPRSYWSIIAPWFYILVIILLALVLFAGDKAQGATRWLRVAGYGFQPSEFAKLSVPIMLAFFLGDRELPPNFLGVFLAAFIIGLPVYMIMIQPDLGTSILVALSGVYVIFLSGISWRYIIGSAIVGLGIAPLVLWKYYLHDYQKARVIAFMDPESDPLGSGYHVIQSKIAIGSGGIYGKGWQQGSQSQLEFIPERSTDFIFSVFSEEFGLVGIVILFALYLFVILRGLYIAANFQNNFARLLSAGLILTLFSYVFVNVGMVSGLLPVVGVPLPLFSYGGTSMLTMMLSIGILMSMQGHKHLMLR